jgi:very-short-patch-repair endonuclease
LEEDFCVKHNSEEVATTFGLSHHTIVKWIMRAMMRHPDMSASFTKIVRNKQISYEIDEAGYDYLCNIYKGIKPASHEYFFKECVIPFLNEMGYDVEYQKTILTYRVDFYIPQLNMVIEYDEDYHRQVKVSEYDKKREADIQAAIGCLFLRIPARYDTIRALGYISSIILQRCLEIENTKP